MLPLWFLLGMKKRASDMEHIWIWSITRLCMKISSPRLGRPTLTCLSAFQLMAQALMLMVLPLDSVITSSGGGGGHGVASAAPSRQSRSHAFGPAKVIATLFVLSSCPVDFITQVARRSPPTTIIEFEESRPPHWNSAQLPAGARRARVDGESQLAKQEHTLRVGVKQKKKKLA